MSTPNQEPRRLSSQRQLKLLKVWLLERVQPLAQSRRKVVQSLDSREFPSALELAASNAAEAILEEVLGVMEELETGDPDDFIDTDETEEEDEED